MCTYNTYNLNAVYVFTKGNIALRCGNLLTEFNYEIVSAVCICENICTRNIRCIVMPCLENVL